MKIKRSPVILEGQAARKFGDQYAQLQPSFQKMRELIDDISRQLSQTATAG